MKKLLIFMIIITFLIACGGNDNSKGDGNNSPLKSNAQNETQSKNNPCGKPVADDGSQPVPLPVC